MENKDIIEEVFEIPSNDSEEIGNIQIAVEVVASIAGIAASEIEGVAGMTGSFAGGIAEIFSGKKNPSKGVKVEITDKTAVVDLYIVVDFGVRIPELAWQIQEHVKNSVETMTGLTVEKINVHVDGVSFEKEKNQLTEIPEDNEEEIIIEDVEE